MTRDSGLDAFELVCLIVIIVLVGAVALAREAKTRENGASNLKTKKQRTNIKANVATLSINVITIALPRLFLISSNLKNSPAVKATNTKATSLIKLERVINSPGIRLITLGPIKIPTSK